MPLDIVIDVLCCKFCEDLSRNATKKIQQLLKKLLFPEKLENNLQTMCTILVYALVFAYCRQDNDVMLTSDNRISRLIGPSDASPDVTRLSGIYCMPKLTKSVDLIWQIVSLKAGNLFIAIEVKRRKFAVPSHKIGMAARQ